MFSCTYACKLILFLLIIFIAGYVILKNEKVEKFMDNTTNDDDGLANEVVTTVFKNYLSRSPSKDEIAKYKSAMTSSQDYQTVVEMLKNTDEYKQLIIGSNANIDVLTSDDIGSSQLVKDLQKVDIDTRMETYRTIIDAYNKALDRYPNNRELVYYSHKMLADTDFNIDKLIQILESSQEYKIRDKNQTNIVNAELTGVITDAQLIYEVRRLYDGVFGSQPTSEVEGFLKQKYIEYNLDDSKFQALLLFLQKMDANQYTIGKDGNVTMSYIDKDASTRKETKEKYAALQFGKGDQYTDVDANMSTLLQTSSNVTSEDNTKNIYNNPNIINIINPSAEDLEALLEKIDKYDLKKAIVKNQGVGAAAACYNKKKVAASATTNNSINFNKDCQDNALIARDRDMLSEHIMNRDLDSLKTACTRNTYYASIDSDLSSTAASAPQTKYKFNAEPIVYDANPFHGTPLADAVKTSVGSIMPPFVYKEV